ncbi:MAG TPA: S-methyl-5-thioribose-1-phosphate isomerase [Kofleriaceae bacterium]|nr:S-methyl-5-thioribose-1-phosphate isomerase [Kofleriaceae bacterium]
MKVDGRWRRTIELDASGTVIVLDQSRLPYDIEWLPLRTLDDAASAIRDMKIRGAPLIGATAAYGVAIALRDGATLEHACEVLARTRPTAINLRWALDEMRRRVVDYDPFAAAALIADEDVATCEAIGTHGLELIKRIDKPRVNVLTHCNAGWLATVDWGTALAPVYKAHEAGIDVHVWVDETRPRNQGLLTAWELKQHGVPHTVIADNAGGHLMQQRQVDLCIVGTDRTTKNGDVCNKIGTYLKALAAHDNAIPFYAAVPSSSIDFTVGEPHEIPIEERSGDEVRLIRGASVIAADTAVANPAFDVTPRRLMTGLITERGIADPAAASLAALFPERTR